MGSYIRYALASTPQPRDRLENRRGTDDEMSRKVWKEMENRKTDEARIAKEKRGKERRF